MEAFLKGRSQQKLKNFLFVSLQEYKKVVQKMYMDLPSLLKGYTPAQRLAYIAYKQDPKTMKRLRSLLKQITLGNMTTKSPVFYKFLLENSSSDGDTPSTRTSTADAMYFSDDDYDEDEEMEEIILG